MQGNITLEPLVGKELTMKMRFTVGVWAVALGLCVSTAMACPKEDSAKAKTADAQQPRGSEVVADGGSAAIMVASKANDGRSEATPEIKKSSGCSKPCGSKSVDLTAATKSKGAAGKGCCKKKAARMAADKTPDGTVQNCPFTGKPCAEGDCPMAKKVSAIMASMPAIQYRVGAETTDCSKSAASMAEKTGKSIEYLVRDEVFKSKGKAVAKLTSLLDDEIESMRSIQYVAGGKCHRCPVTAKSVAKSSKTTVVYRVGGVDFEKESDAQKAIDAMTEAIAEVSMTYKVDGKTYGCEKMAGAKCKKSGKEMTYVIGDTETNCQTSAKLRLAEARIRAMVTVAVATVYGSSSS